MCTKAILGKRYLPRPAVLEAQVLCNFSSSKGHVMFEHNRQKSETGLNRREVIQLGAAIAALPLLRDIAALSQGPADAHGIGGMASTQATTPARNTPH